MPAVLRAYGKNFDVDAFLANCTLPVCEVKRKGQPVFPASKPDGRRHEASGVHVLASDEDFNQFPRQVEESITFLQGSEVEVRRLCSFPGVEGVTLDFGIERRDVPVSGPPASRGGRANEAESLYRRGAAAYDLVRNYSIMDET